MMAALEPAHWWLLAGALCLALEAFGVPGIGFLFAGLAAIIVGILTHFHIIGDSSIALQFGVFFGLTGVLAVLLWKKLKQGKFGPRKSGDYSNIIGDMATVGRDGLRRGMIGQVSWSGTTMMAELAADALTDHCLEGEMVTIVEVKGNKLIVKPVN